MSAFNLEVFIEVAALVEILQVVISKVSSLMLECVDRYLHIDLLHFLNAFHELQINSL